MEGALDLQNLPGGNPGLVVQPEASRVIGAHRVDEESEAQRGPGEAGGLSITKAFAPCKLPGEGSAQGGFSRQAGGEKLQQEPGRSKKRGAPSEGCRSGTGLRRGRAGWVLQGGLGNVGALVCGLEVVTLQCEQRGKDGSDTQPSASTQEVLTEKSLSLLHCHCVCEPRRHSLSLPHLPTQSPGLAQPCFSLPTQSAGGEVISCKQCPHVTPLHWSILIMKVISEVY